MSNQKVLVHYILHNNARVDKNFIIDVLTNQLFITDHKVQILGKLNKQTLLSQIRKQFEWKKDEVIFMKKSFTKTNQVSIFSSEGNLEQQNQLNQKFQFVHTAGEQTIKLMEIFDYSLTLKVITEQLDRNQSYSEFYLIHLCTTSQYHESSIVKKINKKREQLSVPKGQGISLFSNKKMDQISKQLDDKINKVFDEEQVKINNVIQNNPPKSSTTVITNPQSGPKTGQKVIVNEKSTTIINEAKKEPTSNESIKLESNLTKKLSKMTTKEQIQSTLHLARVTHRSFHKSEEIKQRSIVDFQNSKIELINAYKNFFYEKQVILKDQYQARHLKESLNSIEFKLDVGAPNAALDSKISMALLRTNTQSQQTYLHNESFSQIHIAYSFQQAFQIQPDNIMLNCNLRNAFKQIFMMYLVFSKKAENDESFFNTKIQEIPEIQSRLQIFFSQYGSQIQTGVYVFGGKYLAQTSFKFLENLDVKSKEKVRSEEGKFTLKGGYVNVGVGGAIKTTDKEQDHIATQNAIISRSYILFPGASKNLTQWNNALQNSRQDWKLILKDVNKIFIGDILNNSLNSQEFLLIDSNAYNKFLIRIKEYYESFSFNNKKDRDEGFFKFRKNRLFVLWKQQIIKTVKVIKLTPVEKHKVQAENSQYFQERLNKNPHHRINSQRRLLSQEKDHKEEGEYNIKRRQKSKKEYQGCIPKQKSFYILLRSQQINSAYSNILADESESEQKRQIYDSAFQKCIFKYLCCCFVGRKPKLSQMQMKRKKFAKYFSDNHQEKQINHSDLAIYNIEIQNSFNRIRNNMNILADQSQIISLSPKIKHIFDITEEDFQQGRMDGLIFRTIAKKDFFNRIQKFEIYFSIEFMNKKKGLLNMLQGSQQQYAIVRVKNIRKVNFFGEVIADKVDNYQNLFFNDPSKQHFMLIQKLNNIGK